MSTRRVADLIIKALRRHVTFASVSVCMLLIGVTRAGEIAHLTASLPDIDPPPQGQAQWVARSMRLNGLPMTIKSFSTTMSVDDVLNYYEHWWSGRELAQYTRSKSGEWRMLGIHGEKVAVTIEARSALGGSEGTITVSPKLGNVTKPVTQFPHPLMTKVVNLQEYDDDGIEAEHISMTSQRDVGSESSDFASLLKRNGWQLVISRRAASQADGYVIEAQKGGQQVQLVFKQNASSTERTGIAVIWIKS